jgi:hypothetical protein
MLWHENGEHNLRKPIGFHSLLLSPMKPFTVRVPTLQRDLSVSDNDGLMDR